MQGQTNDHTVSALPEMPDEALAQFDNILIMFFVVARVGGQI